MNDDEIELQNRKDTSDDNLESSDTLGNLEVRNSIREDIHINISKEPSTIDHLTSYDGRPFSGYSLEMESRNLEALNFEEGRYFQCAPSAESLLAKLENRKNMRTGNSRSSLTPSNSWGSNVFDNRHIINDNTEDQQIIPEINQVSYPSWENTFPPVTVEEIDEIFTKLSQVFGFQKSSCKNVMESLMIMLDSKASRMPSNNALSCLHSDYIGGINSNYRKWIFSVKLYHDGCLKIDIPDDIDSNVDDKKIKNLWRKRMEKIDCKSKLTHVILYLLIWGEASNLRFCPELICFIFKLALDHYYSQDISNVFREEFSFLNKVVSPLYDYIRDQGYELVCNKFRRRENDHSSTIGYDDINEFFWNIHLMNRIRDNSKVSIFNIQPHLRYNEIEERNWKGIFSKTFKERRTPLHLLTNFSRIWIFHIVIFYFYLVANADFLHTTSSTTKGGVEDRDVNVPLKLAWMSLGGSLACIISIFSTLTEFLFVVLQLKRFATLLTRIILLSLLMSLNIAPFIYIYFINSKNSISYIISIIDFVVAILTTTYLTLMPSGTLLFNKFGCNLNKNSNLINTTFASSFPKLKSKDRVISILLWSLIIVCKLWESYFFLALSFKDVFRIMIQVDVPDCKDAFLGTKFCHYMPIITLIIMTLLDLVLFFLDTYFWYIVWNSIFSVLESFYVGISILTPWKNIFSRLPKRIHTKIIASGDMCLKYKAKFLVSRIWNSIVISMYRDHLISIDHLQRLMYQTSPPTSENGLKKQLNPPTFFVAQEDTTLKAEFFPNNSEAERRISFFAQSLSTVLPEPISVDKMPSFTVFTPHYSEKIILGLREIIREDSSNSRVSLLEYLKSLHKVEWENFVKDTKVLAEENIIYSEDNPPFVSESPISENEEQDRKSSTDKSRLDDLPLYAIGFKSASPEYIIRTRIWASLRSQTLYRTVSGFMNYNKAIKLLYRVENPDMLRTYAAYNINPEIEIEKIAFRKFRFLVSMQRFQNFDNEELDDIEFLLKAYPMLQIAYLEEKIIENPNNKNEEQVEIEKGANVTSKVEYFACLIDGYSEIDSDGKRIPKYRIKLAGHPILGDGKADNQNLSIIFCRGEYVQLIDANQDNYLEEALKIRNILSEFEQFSVDPTISPYSSLHPLNSEKCKPPVAIVGAREYIFSENCGVLGDVAAAKEQTFGTLTHRIMAKVGGKLHYGHPDFLDFSFMTTRGGVSKGQKGLHLNEDIYAGMTAFSRGGRIKHTEYLQCGKGRDLGFSSILNFNTKIGSGMAEQMLSREHYWLGTRLPFDRFLTFYYAHPGFHVNNVLIILATNLILLSLLCVGVLNLTIESCKPENVDMVNCFEIGPIYQWIKATVISIFVVFAVSYLPLFLQVFSEQGFFKTIIRLLKHFSSFSPLFEVFVNKIYSNSLLANLSFGNAKYIGTGRGYAITRVPFYLLYSRFAQSSLYTGSMFLLILAFASATVWLPHLLYFWFMALSLVLAPFIFNPHMFDVADNFLDYLMLWNWFLGGNCDASTGESWVSHARDVRTRFTGMKRKRLGKSLSKDENLIQHLKISSNQNQKPNFLVILAPQILVPLLTTALIIYIYCFLGSLTKKPKSLLRVLIIAVTPIIINTITVITTFIFAILFGPILRLFSTGFPTLLSTLTKLFSLALFLILFVFASILEDFELSSTLLLVISSVFVHRLILTLITSLLLSREFGIQGQANLSFWSGKWTGRGMGLDLMILMIREIFIKIVETSQFSYDFFIAHLILFILFPMFLIPGIDRIHSKMLFWLRSTDSLKTPIFSFKSRRLRARKFKLALLLFLIVFLICLATVLVPFICGPLVGSRLKRMGIIQLLI